MKMSTKKIIAAVFAAVVLALAVFVIAQRTGAAPGTKEFTFTVISERDGFNQTETCKSDYEFLGQFLRELDKLEYTEGAYGIYITSYDGMDEDIAGQYWWCIAVNGESAAAGADEIPLEDGGEYALILTKGW